MNIQDMTLANEDFVSQKRELLLIKNQLEDLEEIKRKYECLFDRSIESIYIHDLEGNFLDINKSGLEMIGYSQEEISGLKLSDLLNDYQLPQAMALTGEVITDGYTGHPVEFKIKRKNNEWLDVEVFPSPVYKNRTPVAIIGVCRDVTDRKNYELALQESEKSFRAIAENAGTGIIVIIGEEGRLVYSNKAFSALSGFSFNELRQMNIRDLASPSSSHILLSRHKAILDGSTFKKLVEAEIGKKDGAIINVEISGTRTYWKGDYADLVLINEVSASRKDAVSRLKRSEDLYSLALEAGKLRFWEWDALTDEISTDSGTPNPSDWGFRGNIQNLLKLVHEHDRPSIDKLYNDIRNGNDQFSIKLRMSRDGIETVWTQVDGRVYRNEAGKPAKIIGVGKDITEQLLAEEKKAELLKEKTNILDNMGEGLVAFDMQGNIIEANNAFLSFSGLFSEEVIGYSFLDIIESKVSHEDFERISSFFHEFMAGKNLPSFDITVVNKEDRKRIVNFITSFLNDINDNPRGVICVIKDVTNQKRVQELFRVSRDELELKLKDTSIELKEAMKMLDMQLERRLLLEDLIKKQRNLAIEFNATQNHDMLISQAMLMALNIPGIDCTAVYVINKVKSKMEMLANNGFSQKIADCLSSLSLNTEQMKPLMEGSAQYVLFTDLFPSDNDVNAEESLKGFGLIPVKFEHRFIAILVLASKALDEIPVYAREFLESVATQAGAALFRMLTEEKLKKKQLALLASEEKFRSLVESMNEVFYLVNTRGVITYISPSVEKIFGYAKNEIIGKNYLDFIPSDDRDRLASLFVEALSGKTYEGDYAIYDKSGNLRWIQISVKVSNIGNRVTGLQGIFTDITQRKHLQQRLVLSERMAATGQLAASIAHEINSPLQAITITLSSLKRLCSNNQDISDGIDLLKAAFFSISETVKNLLDLNRSGTGDRRITDINSIITKTAALVKAQLRQNRIKVNLDLQDDLPLVNISPQSVGQVFLNLINNALDAISGDARNDTDYNQDSYGGLINIESLVEDGMVTVKLSDTGPGILSDDTEKIFTPFYTTKKSSGVGIGLSICRTIIEDHGGTLTTSKANERGAVFIAKFPPAKDEQI